MEPEIGLETCPSPAMAAHGTHTHQTRLKNQHSVAEKKGEKDDVMGMLELTSTLNDDYA